MHQRVYRLSLKYEPCQTPELRKRHTEHHITPPSSTTMLRTSKSHEDLLTQLAAEGLQDTESPFSSNQRFSFLRRSLNSGSTSSQRDSPRRDTLSAKLARHKFAIPSLSEQREEKLSSSSVEVARKTTTLPSSLRDPKLLAPFPDHWAQSKPRSASDWTAPSKKQGGAQTSTSFSSLVRGATPPPSATQRPPPSPQSQSRSKKEVRGHKKSNSLGSK